MLLMLKKLALLAYLHPEDGARIYLRSISTNHAVQTPKNTINNKSKSPVLIECQPMGTGVPPGVLILITGLRRFEARRGEWFFFSIYLILPAALGPGVYSVSNILVNEYQKQQKKKKNSRSRARPVRRANNLAAICQPIVYTMWEPQHLVTLQAFLLDWVESLDSSPTRIIQWIIPPDLLIGDSVDSRAGLNGVKYRYIAHSGNRTPIRIPARLYVVNRS
jgi:hypothetical protein